MYRILTSNPGPLLFRDPETASDSWPVIAFWLSLLAIVATYLNAEGREKFRKTEWLISTILLKFNHLG
jgi:hypothetical protein